MSLVLVTTYLESITKIQANKIEQVPKVPSRVSPEVQSSSVESVESTLQATSDSGGSQNQSRECFVIEQ